MTQGGQIYKCEVCGNIVEVLYSGAGQLICCGQPMISLEEKNKDEGLEKHVPVIEK
jgi:superoxide reductase